MQNAAQVLRAIVALALVWAPTPSSSQTVPRETRQQSILPFTQFTLDNGLTLLVCEDHKLPIASVTVVYNVGSRFDPPGRSGMSHLFEHLLFYGSQHSPHNYLETMKKLGAPNVNGGTGIDSTDLIETAPISQLDAVLWLESDRMGYLILTQKTLAEQVEIIRNEISLDRDQPGGDVRNRIAAGVFPANHPYHKETVGDPKELGSITLDEVRDFDKTYYEPSNAAIVIAGDITPSEAFEKVRHYFGGLPAGPRPTRMTAWVPDLAHDKRERMFDNASPKLFLNWPMPSFSTPDDVYLRLAGSILMDGASSRVRRRLSTAGFNGADLSWSINARVMASIFQISANAASPAEFRTIERLIRDEIAILATKQPTAEELERAKRSRVMELRRLTEPTSGFGGRSDLLGTVWALGDGNAGLLDNQMQRLRAARPEEVSAATQRWLNRAAYILDLEPREEYRTTATDVDRTAMPKPAAFKPAAFPPTHVVTLPNGLEVHHAQWPGGPLAVASLIVRGGAGVDPRDASGLGKLTASLLSAGTGRMTENQLADAFAHLDASVEAKADNDSLTITLVAPKEQLKPALDLVGAMVAEPTFPAAAIEREKKRQLAELEEIVNTPAAIARAKARRLLYGGDSPYASQGNGLGTKTGVGSITRADVSDYHARWFNPANSELIVVGDIGEAETQAALASNLGSWTSSAFQAPLPSVPEQVAAPGVYLIDRPGMQQADLTAATLLDAPASDANGANHVMANILGDRVFADLRDRKHWAYGAAGLIEGGRAGQMLLVRTQVQSQHAVEAIAAIKVQIEGMKGAKAVASDEMQSTKDALTLGLPLKWETAEGVAEAIATSLSRGLPSRAVEKFAADVRSATTEQVQQEAREVLRPGEMVWIVIGDRSKIEPQLKKAGMDFKLLPTDQ